MQALQHMRAQADASFNHQVGRAMISYLNTSIPTGTRSHSSSPRPFMKPVSRARASVRLDSKAPCSARSASCKLPWPLSTACTSGSTSAMRPRTRCKVRPFVWAVDLGVQSRADSQFLVGCPACVVTMHPCLRLTMAPLGNQARTV